MASSRMRADLLGPDLGIGVRHGEDDRLLRHRLDHLGRERPLDGKAEDHIGADERIGEAARLGLGRMGRFPLVHALGAPLIDHPLGVAEDDVAGLESDRLDELGASDARRARPVDHKARLLDVAAREMKRVDEAGRRDDRGAVLIVMEDRDVHELAKPRLDDEAFGGADVLEVDAAESGREIAHRVDEGLGILRAHLEIDRIDVGKALEEHRLAFHHGLRGERAEIAEA